MSISAPDTLGSGFSPEIRGLPFSVVTLMVLGLCSGGSPWAMPFIARANGMLAKLLHESGLREAELGYATQLALHVVTSAAQSEVLRQKTTEQNNRAFAKTIMEHLPEEVRETWPRVGSETNWSLSFDDFFTYATGALLHGVRPKRRRGRG